MIIVFLNRRGWSPRLIFAVGFLFIMALVLAAFFWLLGTLHASRPKAPEPWTPSPGMMDTRHG